MLSTLYPTHPWQPWKLTVTPRDWWSNDSNQLEYFKWLTKELKIEELSQWYNVTAESIDKLGGKNIDSMLFIQFWLTLTSVVGRPLLQMFDNRVYDLLKHFLSLECFIPPNGLIPWKFKEAHRFQSLQDQQQYIEWLALQLNVKTLEDWYSVHISQIIQQPCMFWNLFLCS